MGCCFAKNKDEEDLSSLNKSNSSKNKAEKLLENQSTASTSPSGKKRKGKGKNSQPTEALMFNHPSKFKHFDRILCLTMMYFSVA